MQWQSLPSGSSEVKAIFLRNRKELRKNCFPSYYHCCLFPFCSGLYIFPVLFLSLLFFVQLLAERITETRRLNELKDLTVWKLLKRFFLIYVAGNTAIISGGVRCGFFDFGKILLTVPIKT